MRSGARLLALVPLLFLVAGPAAARESPPPTRGVAVLSSSIGHEVSLDEIDAFVRSCRLNLVVVDFAWITAHWPRTDLVAVETLARRLRAEGAAVAAMYRPRALAPGDADVRFARDEEGGVAPDHDELCFADERSVAWGLGWGEKILEACPSIDRIVLYNVRAPCRCERCRDGKGREYAEAFVRAAAAAWRKLRPGVLVGHVGVGAEYAGAVDFLWPFLSVIREKKGTPVDADALARRIADLSKETGAKPVTPLLKTCWNSTEANETQDVVAALRACEERKLGFVLWYYSWLFHPEGADYDANALVEALGGRPGDLAPFLDGKRAIPADPRQWLFFDSRESKDGPKLVFGKGSAVSEVLADADGVLISYLPEQVGGHLRQLAVSLGDTNRVLLRFPLKRARRGVPVRLVLTAHLSEAPPAVPFDLAVHRVTEEWSEDEVRWSGQPSFEKDAARVATVPAAAGRVEIDVTDLVHDWMRHPRENHGLLLKVAKPVADPAESSLHSDGEDLLDEALAAWPWAADLEAAKRRAAAEKRLVLAVVTASFESGLGRDEQEDLLLSTVLCHPEVLRLGASAFVPLRVHVNPAECTMPRVAGGAPDPLAPLGTSVETVVPPALLVSTPDGTAVASLARLGTFDHRQVLGLLRRAVRSALPEARLPEAGKETEEPAATYWRAVGLGREGRAGEARTLLERIARDHDARPWGLKAKLRLAFPERVDLSESASPLALGGEDAPSEVSVPLSREEEVRRLATDFLLERQQADGSWPVAETRARPFQTGVSVLAAHALLVRVRSASGARKRRLLAALDRADRWLEANVARADAHTLNSFAAAYFVDYRLAAWKEKRATRDDVRTAIRQLVEGQLENGAWSYDRRFGETWTGGFGGWPATTKGRSHSVNAGLALLALADAKGAGFAVPDDALAAGTAALLDMKEGPARWTYTWPEPRNFESAESGVARAPLCEQALLAIGAGSRDDLEKALDTFRENRTSLRRCVKLSESWLPPKAYSDYFYFFAYYHAARALVALGGDRSQKDLGTLRDDLLHAVEPDGTWVDDPTIGKPYGTAMALLVLDLAD